MGFNNSTKVVFFISILCCAALFSVIVRMKAATVKELKTELILRSEKDLINICLRLSKFKKENKELLSYLLYDEGNEEGFIQDMKYEIDDQFDEINLTSYFFIKKTVRKILRNVKKHIRYSQKKTTEVELLIYFCMKLKTMKPTYTRNTILVNTLIKQKEMIEKAINSLEDDLQYDYKPQFEELNS